MRAVSGQSVSRPQLEDDQDSVDLFWGVISVKSLSPGNSLAVQWLGLCAFTAAGLDSIPGQGTKIPLALWCGQIKKKF